MKNYVYSAKSNSFYPLQLKSEYEQANSWPDDPVEVDDDIFVEFSGTPPEGKQRGAGSDGMPHWVDIPPLPNSVVLAGIISSLGIDYKNEIAELNAAYLSAVVSDGPSEVAKQQVVRDQISARKAKYAADIADAKEKYPT
jgi:hypothetical protein